MSTSNPFRRLSAGKFRKSSSGSERNVDNFVSRSTSNLSVQEEQTLIAVVGVTGSGKSSFIKRVTKKDDIEIGDGLCSTTQQVKEYDYQFNGQSFKLIDTPGFDDTEVDDEDIFESLVDWLEKSYRKGQRLTGLLYLHRIISNREKGSDLRNLRVFQKLCGDKSFSNVVIGITYWDQEDPEVADSREKVLKESDDFWGGMVKKGAQVVRMPLDEKGCQGLLMNLGARKTTTLDVQDEVVNQGKSAKETSAHSAMASYDRSSAIRDNELLERMAQQIRHNALLLRQHQENYRRQAEQMARHEEEEEQQLAELEALVKKQREEAQASHARTEARKKRFEELQRQLQDATGRAGPSTQENPNITLEQWLFRTSSPTSPASPASGKQSPQSPATGENNLSSRLAATTISQRSPSPGYTPAKKPGILNTAAIEAFKQIQTPSSQPKPAPENRFTLPLRDKAEESLRKAQELRAQNLAEQAKATEEARRRRVLVAQMEEQRKKAEAQLMRELENAKAKAAEEAARKEQAAKQAAKEEALKEAARLKALYAKQAAELEAAKKAQRDMEAAVAEEKRKWAEMVAKQKLQEQQRELESRESSRIVARTTAHVQTIQDWMQVFSNYRPLSVTAALTKQAWQGVMYTINQVNMPGPLQKAFCDFCLCRLPTLEGHWACYECLSSDLGGLAICNACKVSRSKTCLNANHKPQFEAWSEELRHGPFTTCCRLKVRFLSEGLICSLCRDTLGPLFFHCCSCDNDDFDMCLSCWGDRSRRCPGGTHTLWLHAWAPPSERILSLDL